MTVQELIDLLNSIPDKTMVIRQEYDGSVSDVEINDIEITNINVPCQGYGGAEDAEGNYVRGPFIICPADKSS